MRELGYKPNNLARSLQGKSAKLIGLIFPNISNVFYAELIDKLEHQLFKNGYKTIICNSEHDSEKEREYIEMLEANQVDGIISGSHNLGIEDYNRVTSRNDTVYLIGLQHFNILPFFFRVVFAVTDDGLVAIFEELVFQLVMECNLV